LRHHSRTIEWSKGNRSPANLTPPAAGKCLGISRKRSTWLTMTRAAEGMIRTVRRPAPRGTRRASDLSLAEYRIEESSRAIRGHRGGLLDIADRTTRALPISVAAAMRPSRQTGRGSGEFGGPPRRNPHFRDCPESTAEAARTTPWTDDGTRAGCCLRRLSTPALDFERWGRETHAP
jgi:hypothetical protein